MEVEVRDLVVWRGGTRAVDRVGFAIGSGQWVGVVGANGSGKTSLLRALAGRVEIASGEIIVDGEDRAADRFWRARAFGFAPEASALPQSLTGAELFAILLPEGQGRDEAVLAPLRAALAFDAFLHRRIGALSAGMRQRLAIYAAFLSPAGLVILDEPFNWLDPVCAFDTRAALRSLVTEQKLTLVTALHETGTLLQHCSAGILLSDGRVSRRLSQADLEEGAQDYAAFEAGLIAALRSGPAQSVVSGGGGA